MTAPDKKCEHNLSIHTRYMSWCSVCGSMRHGRSKTWQLPTRPVQAVESTCKHWIDGQITGECNHQLPPPSGLVALDEKEAIEWLEQEWAIGNMNGKTPTQIISNLGKRLASRFGVPGAMAVPSDIIEFLEEVRDRASYGKAVVPMIEDKISELKTGEKGGS